MRAVQFDGPLNRPHCDNISEKRKPEGIAIWSSSLIYPRNLAYQEPYRSSKIGT